MPRSLLPCAVAVVLLTAACGSSAPSHPKHLGAAEPAKAPAPTAPAAGTSSPVGDLPEGIVYDPVSKLVVVGVRNPDRLALLDPTTLAVRSTIPIPGDVRHLQLGYGGGSVLVPAESASRILQVPLPSGSITSAKVLRQPHDAAQLPNGDVIVGNEFGKSISVVHDGTVVKTIADLTQPGGVIADGATVGVVDVGNFTISTYDIGTLTRTARVSAGKGPTHGLLISGDRFLVADTRGNRMLVYSVAPLKQIGALDLPGTPYGMAVDDTTGLVWITLTAANQVVGLDVSASTPKVVARYATVQQPNTVAVEPGSHTLFVTGTKTGVVERITR